MRQNTESQTRRYPEKIAVGTHYANHLTNVYTGKEHKAQPYGDKEGHTVFQQHAPQRRFPDFFDCIHKLIRVQR
jgi:hypothetical protein